MKKYTILLFTLILFITFTSCKNPPIFATIEQEVKLKNFSVKGTILGFAELGSNIYVANPAAVFTKAKTSTGSWSSIGNLGGHTTALLSDGTNIFASVREGGVYTYDKANKKWSLIPDTKKFNAIYGDKNIIASAYDSKAEKYKFYKLTTTGATPITNGGSDLTSDKRLKGASGSFFATENKLYDLSGNEKKSIDGIRAMCAGPGTTPTVLILAGSNIHQYDGTNIKQQSISKSDANAIFYFEARKTILISCNTGYTELQFDTANPNDITKASQINPGGIGSTTKPSSYKQYDATLSSSTFDPIFAVKTTGSNYVIYVGISANPLRKKTGLWAYYSSTQEWNRE